MSDRRQDALDGDSVEPGAIGVGMGGSCPVCRAPVDLGQEFCLECGSPIRFTPRQRRQQRSTSQATGPAPISPPRRSGFPWIPFLIVLALIGGGIAFAVVGNGSDKKPTSSGDTTEDSLPEITNSVPETTTGPEATQTTTLQDCDPSQPLGGAQPAVTDGSSIPSATPTNEQIPELEPNGTPTPTPTDGFADPSVPPTGNDPSSGEAPVTVDQNGNLCPSADAASTSPQSTPTSTSPAATSDTATSGEWPAGKDGWTVIVAGYPTQDRATTRAADVQEDGFEGSGVLFSSEFTSLCPGIYVVFSGTFTKESEAKARLTELSKLPDYAGMYVREIRTTGSPAAGCTQVN